VSAEASAQRRVTGRVTGAAGEPVQAASVSVQGTTIGTYTAEDGRFTLNSVPQGTQVLVVRRIGYQRTSTPLGAGQDQVNVQLQRDVLQLEAQVITGAATTISRRNAANDVATVSTEELNRAPTPTVENALQGKIAGANIVTNSGAPGGGAQFRIRGASSILGNSDPLLIVDGVIISNDAIAPGTNAVLGASAGVNGSSQDNAVNRIADINPNDIENIEVLKGASATQIYGSRASNGVIIITTKRGTSGAAQFNITQRLGTYSLLKKIPTRQFSLQEALDQGADLGIPAADVQANYTKCGGFCDHQQELFGNSDLSYETNLSVRGGGDVAQYFASGLVKRDAGIAMNTGYNKQSLRANVNSTISSRLNLAVNSQLVHSLAERGFSNNDNVNVTPYFVFPATPSWFDLRPSNGVYPINPFTSSNPLQTFAFIRTPEEVWRGIVSATGDWSVLAATRQTLNLRVTAGADEFNQQNQVVSPRFLQYEPNDQLPGTATYQSGTNVYGNSGLALTHVFTPVPGTSFTTSLGTQYEYRSQRTSNIVAQDVLFGQENIQNASSLQAFDNRIKQIDQAFYAQEEFLGLDERLLLTGAVRGQKSTVNGNPAKYYIFPKFAASYRVPTLVSFVNELKLRGAYGQAGNPPLISAAFTPAVVTNYSGSVGYVSGLRLGNPNIRPEKQSEIEGGADITLFNGRGSIALTGYQRKITDLLIRPALAPSLGITSEDLNAGAMTNTGFEATAAVTPYQSTVGNWIARLTYSKNVNKVTSLPELVGHVACLNAAGTALETVQTNCPRGYTAGAFGFAYGQGRVEEGASLTQVVGSDTLPGGVAYQRRYGDTEPRYALGFSNEITYKGFRLYGLLDYRPGSVAVNLTQSTYDDNGTYGDTAATTRREDAIGAGLSPYIQDNGYLALREVTLGWALPTRLTQAVFGGRAQNVSLEVSGRNLKYWTSYEGVTPEVSNFGNQNVIRNQDLAPFPMSRGIFVSLNAAF
jgi:TonB-linked SusC/RagA family outer membrane protein